MKNVLDRINQLALNELLTITSLEREIGASKGVLSRAIKNQTDIQSKWIIKIVENYPRYNPDWLLTGKGSMLREPGGPVPDPDLPEVRKQISRLLELLDQKDREIKELKKELESKNDAERKQLERTLEELKKGKR